MLEARGLDVAPPGRDEPVVRDLSLAVAPGEWIALAGRNGGGKTTLALALAGLWPRRAGTLTWRGRAIGPGEDPTARADVACVLQDPSSQLLEATVADELALGARHAGLDGAAHDEAVRAWAARFGLVPELARDPQVLSAGAQQRVLLAAALAARPRLLVADEPAAHLDPAWREAALACVHEARVAGLAVVWVTQDARERAAADRVIELAGTPAPELAPAAPEDPGATRLCATIEPSEGADGPRVSVASRLAIEIGERGVTALEGPNGAGKTVLLGALAGVATVPGVALAWQGPPASPAMLTLQYPELQVFEERVDDEIAFAAVARGRERAAALAAARAALAALGFDAEALLARRTWELSTGEKRVVELVAALVAPAGLLLLDEPTAGLDPARRAALAGLVAGRSREGPVVIASQDPGWIEALGARRVRLGAAAEAAAGRIGR